MNPFPKAFDKLNAEKLAPTIGELRRRLSDPVRNPDGLAALAEIDRVNACWSEAMNQIRRYKGERG